MKNRRVVGLIGLAVLAVAAVLFWPHGPRPCRATFEQVHKGMTLEEVCATVGGPPGTYTSRPVLPLFMCGFSRHRVVRWHAPDATLTVFYEDDGLVFGAYVDDPLPDRRPLLDRLRAQFGF